MSNIFLYITTVFYQCSSYRRRPTIIPSLILIHRILLFNLAAYSSLHFHIFRWLILQLPALSLPSLYHTLYLLSNDQQDGQCGEAADDTDEEDNGSGRHAR